MSGITPTPSPKSMLDELATRSVTLPDGLVERTLERLQWELARRRRLKRVVVGRLTLAALLTLPVVLAVNAIEAYLLFTALDRYLPASLAGAATGVVVLSMLLTLAVAYGSLPILASFGMKLREQTP